MDPRIEKLRAAGFSDADITEYLKESPPTTAGVGGVYTTAANATAAYDGSKKIYLKFEIVNNTWETKSTETIAIAVDGVIPGTTPTKDVISNTDCNLEADFGKTMNQTIKPRPTITGTPATL